MRLSEWLKIRLDESGLSQAELARRLSERLGRVIDRSIVNKMTLNKRDIAADELFALVAIFGVPNPLETKPPLVSSFDPDEPEPYGDGGTDRPDLPHGVTNDGAATLTIPKGGVAEIDVEPGLGGGGLAAETYVRTPDGNQFPADAIRGIWQLPDHVFTQMRARSQNVRCFPVQGDSMLDTLDEGDFVFVDVAHKVPSPPGIYALDDGFGGIIVKRLEVVDEDDGEPIVRVISDNERYAERRERADNLRIVGRYIAMFTMRNRR
jgi:transcriptional regulator with XRE-family HTH domain